MGARPGCLSAGVPRPSCRGVPAARPGRQARSAQAGLGRRPGRRRGVPRSHRANKCGFRLRCSTNAALCAFFWFDSPLLGGANYATLDTARTNCQQACRIMGQKLASRNLVRFAACLRLRKAPRATARGSEKTASAAAILKSPEPLWLWRGASLKVIHSRSRRSAMQFVECNNIRLSRF